MTLAKPTSGERQWFNLVFAQLMVNAWGLADDAHRRALFGALGKAVSLQMVKAEDLAGGVMALTEAIEEDCGDLLSSAAAQLGSELMLAAEGDEGDLKHATTVANFISEVIAMMIKNGDA